MKGRLLMNILDFIFNQHLNFWGAILIILSLIFLAIFLMYMFFLRPDPEDLIKAGKRSIFISLSLLFLLICLETRMYNKYLYLVNNATFSSNFFETKSYTNSMSRNTYEWIFDRLNINYDEFKSSNPKSNNQSNPFAF